MANPRRHLLVDGHNVLHAWGWMNLGEPVARERLIEALRVLQDVESLEITLVFDSRGDVANVDPAAARAGFVVKYAAAGLSADGEIERLVAADSSPQRCVVATNDTTIRGNALASGAEMISPEELRAWLQRAEARARRALRVRTAEQRDKFGNKLPL